MLHRRTRAPHSLHTASPWILSLTNRLSFNASVDPCRHDSITHHDFTNSINGDSYILPGYAVLASTSVKDFACILDRCRKARNRPSALYLHAYMRQNGLEVHQSLGNHLVAMLADVGCMYDAQEAFDKLEFPNELSLDSLISGYIKCRRPQEAFKLYERMQNENGVHFNSHAFIALIQASASLKDLERGAMVHSDIERRGLLERSIFVGSTLVDMYAKCGSVGKAKEVFEKLENRDVVLWNALITGYASHGLGEEALGCFRQMQLEGIFPNAVTFISILKACHDIAGSEKGFEMHDEITKAGFSEDNLLVSSALVDMYAKCGRLAEARQVSDKLAVKDVVLWTALIAGYAEHGPYEKALDCFDQMQSEGVSPDALTFVCSLRACGSIKAREKGQEIHANIKNKGLQRNLFVGSALVDFYGKCGQLDKAQEVFDQLPLQDRVLWSALIAGYVEHGLHEEALKYFYQMQAGGISPDVALWVCSLKACAGLRDTDKCRQVHAEIERLGLSAALNSALVDMYAKCGLLVTAQEVFDKLPVHDVLSWNALLAAHAEHGNGEEVFEQFEQMRLGDVIPDSVTFLCILKACSSAGNEEKGIELHAEIDRRGLLERDLAIGNALVGMYSECGGFNKAQEVFDNLPTRDIVSWNALIAGYVEHEDGDEAVRCFRLMESEGVSPDAVTIACILKVCGNDGAVEWGQEVHATIERLQLLRKSPLVGSALVNMYAKCGLLVRAQQVFDEHLGTHYWPGTPTMAMVMKL